MPLKPKFYEQRESERLEHRARCVVKANEFVSLCKSKGVRIIVFGSLANTKAFFRTNSDIDFCIFDKGSLSFFEIEDIASKIFKGTAIKVDLLEKEFLKADVMDEIIKFGVDYVN